MEKCFSIGEVSKLHNVSVQTLRHYDKIGLLKPAYINESSGYRYYSSKQFIMLGFIKQCKAMGLSLEEIKELVVHRTSLESILEAMTKQKEVVAKKLEELTQIQANIDVLQNKIGRVLQEGIGNIFVSHCQERCFVTYSHSKKSKDAFEVKLTEAIQTIEMQYGTAYKELVLTTSYEKYRQSHVLSYDSMMIGWESMDRGQLTKQVVLPAGNYLTVNFDDRFKSTKPYYDQLISYIEQHQVKVGECFYETYIITRVDGNNKETSLGQIQIQLL